MLRRHLKLVLKLKKLQRRMVWMKKETTVEVMQKLAIEDDLKEEKKRKNEERSIMFLNNFKGT
jgi:hypothetical protein